ncbi:MAG TPA: glycosyltransferase family 4 protein [Methylovirgula sp.]|nr:glycosyltransferase family 4 protein [Methylovirgula sp.]
MRTRLRPLRLFMTADAVGGVFQYAVDLAAALAAHGIETTLALLGPRVSAAQRAALVGVDGLKFIETGLPLDWLAADEGSAMATASAVAALAALNEADAVHLNTPALAIARYPAPVVAVAHSCLASWWAAVKSTALPPDFAWRTRLMARGMAGADVVICPSRSFAQTLAELYGRMPIVVHNGRPSCATSTAEADKAPSAFTAGRLWDEGKNIAVLDAAAGLIDIPLFAAGPVEGPNGTRFTPRHLKCLGSLDAAQMRAELARRPMFVSAALYEPFGLAVLEAAQAGCALILSDIPTFRELWDGAALFVGARDPRAFADALKWLDPVRRAEMGEAARLRAERYCVDRVAATMASIYDGLRQPMRGAA